MNLTQEQSYFAISCMSEWMRICEDNNKSTSDVDINHSALLPYMLQGNRPFEKPPPKSYSYPCYKMAEGKMVLAEVWQHNDNYVIVNQCPTWKWYDKDILKHMPTGDLYRFWEGRPEDIVALSILHPSYSVEKAEKDEAKIIEDLKKKGIRKGFIQRCNGEAPRKIK